jgi:hypothetical protein
MSSDLLSTDEAAQRLGMSRATIYQWLAESDAGTFVLRGCPVSINYFQTGARGRGRIMIEAGEVERLKDLMRVKPNSGRPRAPPKKRSNLRYISAKLGRPDD